MIENLRIETPEEDRRTVPMEFDRARLPSEGTELGARTARCRAVVDGVAERSARIESVEVGVLEPFAPVSHRAPDRGEVTLGRARSSPLGADHIE